MKRQRKKAFVSNPLANATGKQYNDSGKTLTLDASKLGQAGKLSTPQKPYNPEQCSMYVLPTNYKDFNFSQVDGPTITLKHYVNNILGEKDEKLPVSANNSGISSSFMLGLEEATFDTVSAGLGFFRAYKNGYIEKIYDEINKHFKNRSWYDEYLKNTDYYVKGNENCFVYKLIDANIFAGDLDITNSRIFDNVKIAILRFIFNPNGFFENGYANIKNTNAYWVKKVRDKINEFDWIDVASLGLRRVSKEWAKNYFEDEYEKKIVKPNEEIYKKAKEANSKKIDYLQIVKENAALLTVNSVEERKRWSDAITDKPLQRGEISYSGNEDEEENQNRKTNSDKIMILVAGCVLFGIFLLKRKSK